MASEHSYGATLKNNKTETSAVDFVLSSDARFKQLTKEERKEILKRFELKPSFSRAFDLVLVPTPEATIADTPTDQLVLVELKTTQKKLMNIPEGFFFGATENEFQLANKLGIQYKFCFVSLHAESSKYVLVTAKELESLIKTRRLQYQINL